MIKKESFGIGREKVHPMMILNGNSTYRRLVKSNEKSRECTLRPAKQRENKRDQNYEHANKLIE